VCHLPTSHIHIYSHSKVKQNNVWLHSKMQISTYINVSVLVRRKNYHIYNAHQERKRGDEWRILGAIHQASAIWTTWLPCTCCISQCFISGLSPSLPSEFTRFPPRVLVALLALYYAPAGSLLVRYSRLTLSFSSSNHTQNATNLQDVPNFLLKVSSKDKKWIPQASFFNWNNVLGLQMYSFH
jgi:hypothetical protein